MRQIITDNLDEFLEVIRDECYGDKYAIHQIAGGLAPEWRNDRTTVLNPREAEAVRNFIDRNEKG